MRMRMQGLLHQSGGFISAKHVVTGKTVERGDGFCKTRRALHPLGKTPARRRLQLQFSANGRVSAP